MANGDTQLGDPRVPIIFTSTYRQRLGEYNAEPLSASEQVVKPILTGGETATLMSEIEMAINPRSIRWEQPKRWTKRDTREGSAFFHFTNSRGQNNDILTLQFEGTTGNIDTRGSDVTGAFHKWEVWHNLYLLTREPVLLEDGSENLIRITYRSPLWRQAVNFLGFFESVLEFSEVADKPHSRDWSFSFKVMETDPDLDRMLYEMLTTIGPTDVRDFLIEVGEER
jgi:hypothetical protein